LNDPDPVTPAPAGDKQGPLGGTAPSDGAGGGDSATRAQKFWTYVGIATLFLVFGGLAIFLFMYVNSVGFTRLTTIDGTRPLLVVAAIISTIVFGGALLLGSLFSSEGSFEDRFRHAREIFLVFSGIFGTVLGFYFGAGDTKASQLKVDATLQDTTIVAHATGGTPPYRVTFEYGRSASVKTADSDTGWAKLTLDRTKDSVVPLKVRATDSNNIYGSKDVDLNENDLKAAGWSQLPQ